MVAQKYTKSTKVKYYSLLRKVQENRQTFQQCKYLLTSSQFSTTTHKIEKIYGFITTV